jgi:hypothetical protein
MIVNSAGQPVTPPRMGQSSETGTQQGAAQPNVSGSQSGSGSSSGTQQPSSNGRQPCGDE